MCGRAPPVVEKLYRQNSFECEDIMIWGGIVYARTIDFFSIPPAQAEKKLEILLPILRTDSDIPTMYNNEQVEESGKSPIKDTVDRLFERLPRPLNPST